MVARAVGYFGLKFKEYRSVKQGDPLPPTIFNVAVDAVIHYWVAVVAQTEDGTEGIGLSIQDLATHFYAYNGLVAPNHPERLQRTFDVLTGLFDRDSLLTNTRKMVSMACWPCQTPVQMSSEAYKRRTTGTGTNFCEWNRRRATCP